MDVKKLRLIALVLVLAIVVGIVWSMRQVGRYETVAYADMEYTRPDMDAFEKALQKCCDLAENGTKLDDLVGSINTFLRAYDDYSTSYTLADIKYCCDMSDTYWEEEYSFCLQNATTVDAGLDTLLHTLAASTFRGDLEGDDYFGPGFFDNYEGESIWDETFTALMEQEAALEDQYYEASAQLMDAYYGNSEEAYQRCELELARIYVDLIAVRQQIAASQDYDSYPQFAYDFYFARDYTVEQEAELEKQIQTQLAPLYLELDYSGATLRYSSERQTYAYVKDCVSNIGGEIADAFARLEKDGLYDISYGENKYNTSFTTYICNYYAPFVFLCPQMNTYDQLTFAHEFGHFAHNYVVGGSGAGVDVGEVHSQGMEYLSLFYGQKRDKNLEWIKLADCLSTYVEQAAFASFERQAYALTDEELTAEGLQALYLKVCEDFGLAERVTDTLEFTTISHFYTNPMYVISYVVSNDAAFQIYLLEKEASGEGLKVYQECLYNGGDYFLEFVEAVGLDSPFRSGGVTQVRRTLEEILMG